MCATISFTLLQEHAHAPPDFLDDPDGHDAHEPLRISKRIAKNKPTARTIRTSKVPGVRCNACIRSPHSLSCFARAFTRTFSRASARTVARTVARPLARSLARAQTRALLHYPRTVHDERVKCPHDVGTPCKLSTSAYSDARGTEVAAERSSADAPERLGIGRTTWNTISARKISAIASPIGWIEPVTAEKI